MTDRTAFSLVDPDESDWDFRSPEQQHQYMELVRTEHRRLTISHVNVSAPGGVMAAVTYRADRGRHVRVTHIEMLPDGLWSCDDIELSPDTLANVLAQIARHLVAWLHRPLELRPPVQQAPVSPTTRQAVLDRDEHRCVECGDTENLHIDHIYPRSRGGGNEIGNLQVLCGPCNISKGTNTMDEWRASKAARSGAEAER